MTDRRTADHSSLNEQTKHGSSVPVENPDGEATLHVARVIHAQWTDANLHLWVETPGQRTAGQTAVQGQGTTPAAHPACVSASVLTEVLGITGASGNIIVRLPAFVSEVAGIKPVPSPHLAHTLGELSEEADDAEHETAAQEPSVTLVSFNVPTLIVEAGRVAEVLDQIEDRNERAASGLDEGRASSVFLGESTRFFAAASRFARHLLAQQRFVPMLEQHASGALKGVWLPWLGDDAASTRLNRLLAAMPPSARAVVDGMNHDGASIVNDFLLRIGDAACRGALIRDTMGDAIEGRDASSDLHVAWLTGLLASPVELDARPGPRADLVKGVRRWIGSLDERATGAAWRLLMRLSEPLDTAGLADFAAPGDSVRWTLTFHLQCMADPRVILDATDVWSLPPGPANVEGQRIEAPQETLLSELGRASRVFKRVEKALEDAEPSEMLLPTSEAYKFLRETRPLLIEQGIGVEAPDWWDSPSVRLGARLIVQSDDIDLSAPPAILGDGTSGASSTTQLGLSSLVSYRWQIAVGQNTLTMEQFEKLAAQHAPLIRINGKWVEVRPEDIKAAVRFIRENEGAGGNGKMEVGRALRLAYASDPAETGVPILGMDATGWVASVFGEAGKGEKMPLIAAPQGFIGTLRPYQLKGLSWLAFLDRIGLGACLADDMGLGKTIQLLALLAHERSLAKNALAQAGKPVPTESAVVPPTLLIVPMSVVSNWVHEAKRFTPDLNVLVHHGSERLTNEKLIAAARNADVVVTTYSLAYRDREQLGAVNWLRVVLDEAQNIKNPGAKQTRAIHAIPAPRRIALTGTPLENRLIELWSIMDFLNPGYLGHAAEFRRLFAIPIERYRDKHRAAQMRGLVQPFVLRRLKSDPNVITDLPAKVETKEYCFLTPEQANLYQTCVSDMLVAAEKAEGIQRRGLVLAGLIKLKQICNHPAQFLKELGEGTAPTSAELATASASRSGKCQRIIEMLQEVVAAGDKALVFTQFRQMGHILAAMLRQSLDRDVLFLHGGTAAAQRQQIVAEFQGEKTKAGKSGTGGVRAGPPVLILSLKAGGVGLNLTAANHVFHFDRWWNPAVESQATDRAYRIGQTRTVQVHKFVVSGTLEERIDQMIESKTELAAEIVGAGEDWLTELDTTQLRDLLTLRHDAIGDEEDVLEEALP